MLLAGFTLSSLFDSSSKLQQYFDDIFSFLFFHLFLDLLFISWFLTPTWSDPTLTLPRPSSSFLQLWKWAFLTYPLLHNARTNPTPLQSVLLSYIPRTNTIIPNQSQTFLPASFFVAVNFFFASHFSLVFGKICCLSGNSLGNGCPSIRLFFVIFTFNHLFPSHNTYCSFILLLLLLLLPFFPPHIFFFTHLLLQHRYLPHNYYEYPFFSVFCLLLNLFFYNWDGHSELCRPPDQITQCQVSFFHCIRCLIKIIWNLVYFEKLFQKHRH